MNHVPGGSVWFGGGLRGFSSARSVGSASCRVRGLGGGDGGRIPDRACSAGVSVLVGAWGRFPLRKKLLLLWWRQKFEETAEGEEQRIMVSVFDACTGEEIGADHLQTVAA